MTAFHRNGRCSFISASFMSGTMTNGNKCSSFSRYMANNTSASPCSGQSESHASCSRDDATLSLLGHDEISRADGNRCSKYRSVGTLALFSVGDGAGVFSHVSPSGTEGEDAAVGTELEVDEDPIRAWALPPSSSLRRFSNSATRDRLTWFLARGGAGVLDRHILSSRWHLGEHPVSAYKATEDSCHSAYLSHLALPVGPGVHRDFAFAQVVQANGRLSLVFIVSIRKGGVGGREDGVQNTTVGYHLCPIWINSVIRCH